MHLADAHDARGTFAEREASAQTHDTRFFGFLDSCSHCQHRLPSPLHTVSIFFTGAPAPAPAAAMLLPASIVPADRVRKA